MTKPLPAPLDLDEIERLAEKMPTMGRYRVGDDWAFGTEPDHGDDPTWIAASPPIELALVAELRHVRDELQDARNQAERLQTKLVHVRARNQEAWDEIHKCRNELDDTYAELAEARRKLARIAQLVKSLTGPGWVVSAQMIQEVLGS